MGRYLVADEDYRRDERLATPRSRKTEPASEQFAFKSFSRTTALVFGTLLFAAFSARPSVRTEVTVAVGVAAAFGLIGIILWPLELRISWWWRAGAHALGSMALLVAFAHTTGITREWIYSPLGVAIIVALSIGAAIGFADQTRRHR